MRCWPSSERTTNPSSRRKRQDSLSLSLVLFPPKPLRWVSAGALLGEVIKTPVLHFFGTSMWEEYHYPPAAVAVSEQPRAGFISAEKTAFSEWVLCADERAVPSCTQRFFGVPARGVVSLPSACVSCCRNAGRPRVTAAYLPFLCRPGIRPVWAEYPRGGYTHHSIPKRAHSGLHAETRRVLRVNGDDVFGSGIIDTIGPFQADQTVAVALAEGHRNAVSP